VFDAVLAGASMVWGGAQYPIAATIIVVVAFLFVAGRGCDWLLPRLLFLLKNPKSMLKGSYDKRRKD